MTEVMCIRSIGKRIKLGMAGPLGGRGETGRSTRRRSKPSGSTSGVAFLRPDPAAWRSDRPERRSRMAAGGRNRADSGPPIAWKGLRGIPHSRCEVLPLDECLSRIAIVQPSQCRGLRSWLGTIWRRSPGASSSDRSVPATRLLGSRWRVAAQAAEEPSRGLLATAQVALKSRSGSRDLRRSFSRRAAACAAVPDEPS